MKMNTRDVTSNILKSQTCNISEVFLGYILSTDKERIRATPQYLQDYLYPLSDPLTST